MYEIWHKGKGVVLGHASFMNSWGFYFRIDTHLQKRGQLRFIDLPLIASSTMLSHFEIRLVKISYLRLSNNQKMEEGEYNKSKINTYKRLH